MIKILHLCSYYISSKLYKNMFEQMDTKVKQSIYVPMYSNKKELNGVFLPKLINGTIKYSNVFNISNRILFKNKTNRAINRLRLEYNDPIDIRHAHTWFSDGSIAYELFRKDKIPYIVAIRDTDINIFYKYRIDLRKYGQNILLNASKIIFISPSYNGILKEILPSKIYAEISNKIHIIPNGIDDYWLRNPPISRQIRKEKNFIYVGKIISRKNIDLIVQSFLKITNNDSIGKLFLVGFVDDSNYERAIRKEYEGNENIVMIKKQDSTALKSLYQDSDIFVMPSKTETFGLVYIEALSQGLPIIYSKGQGVDGYFNDIKVGIAVDSGIIDEISIAMLELAEKYNAYSHNTIKASHEFDWKNLSNKYVSVYNELLN